MGKITYADKEALNEIPSIADINKCRAADMNEIKNVVNTLLNDVPSSTAPANPVLNDLWIDTEADEYLAQVDDEVSTTSTNAVQNQAITNYVNGTVLFNDATGVTTGGTLDDDVSNYTYLEVFAKMGSAYGYSQKIDLSIINAVEFISLYANSSNLAMKDSVYSFSGTTMTRDLMYTKYGNGTYDASNENGFRVYKVIGYKEA